MPTVLTFFEDLQIYATLLLIQSLILKGMLTFSEKPPDWMTITINKITTAPLTGIFVEKTSKKLPEDAGELVEQIQQQATDKSIVENFVRLVDRSFIILTLVLFCLMFWTLFPKGYLSASYNPIEVLS